MKIAVSAIGVARPETSASRGFILDLAAADDLDRDRLDDQGLVGHHEAVALAMRVLEPLAHRGGVAERDRERRVGTLVFKMRAA